VGRGKEGRRQGKTRGKRGWKDEEGGSDWYLSNKFMEVLIVGR
jgi:hypothetical protein